MPATVYSTKTLAAEIIGSDDKSATRELRKFLRAEMGGGKSVVGKGARYALEMNKESVKELKARFEGWKAQMEAEKAERAAARVITIKPAESDNKPEAPEAVIEPEATETVITGPTDDEIAEMLADLDDSDDTLED